MASRLDLGLDDLASRLGGEPAFRPRQVRQGLLAGRDPLEMTELPESLRTALAASLPPPLRAVSDRVAADGATRKWLWALDDGARVETVLMRYPRRATICVSSQAGCAMACPFCATGQAGFQRHLTAGEILEQIVAVKTAAAEPSTNVLFMGMGEPLANYDAVWASIEALHDQLGVSARRITVSTVGVVPGIRRLAGERLPVNLAVSFHAANDELRNRIVPLNRRYPLAQLTQACEEWVEATGRRLSLEWALIPGVNDRPSHGRELAALARRLRAHVNLIPLNPTPGYEAAGPDPDAVAAFRDILLGAGVNVTVRRNRGTDIDAACGQLAAAGAPPGGPPGGPPSGRSAVPLTGRPGPRPG